MKPIDMKRQVTVGARVKSMKNRELVRFCDTPIEAFYTVRKNAFYVEIFCGVPKRGNSLSDDKIFMKKFCFYGGEKRVVNIHTRENGDRFKCVPPGSPGNFIFFLEGC